MTSMLSCPVCQTENHHLAITCKSCKSFLQQRIENLDLFTTAWNVLERPQKTFHTIALSKHKNYMLLLSSLAGISLAFTVLWFMKAGEYTESLLTLFAAAFVLGPLLGIVVLLFMAVTIVSLAKILRIHATLRNVYAVLSYSMIPHVIRLILILPIELLTFGLFFFTKEPAPYFLRPSSYIILLGLDGLFAVWAFLLSIVGIKKLTESSFTKAFLITTITTVVTAGIIAGGIRLLILTI